MQRGKDFLRLSNCRIQVASRLTFRCRIRIPHQQGTLKNSGVLCIELNVFGGVTAHFVLGCCTSWCRTTDFKWKWFPTVCAQCIFCPGSSFSRVYKRGRILNYSLTPLSVTCLHFLGHGWILIMLVHAVVCFGFHLSASLRIGGIFTL